MTWCNNPDNRNIQQDHCENLKYPKVIGCLHTQQQFYSSAEFQKSVLSFRGTIYHRCLKLKTYLG